LAEPVLDDVLTRGVPKPLELVGGSPLITVVFGQSGSLSVEETTYLSMLLMRSL